MGIKQFTYLLGNWIDLGAGCCSKDGSKEHTSFGGYLTNGTLQSCKKKCLEDKDCKIIAYGWHSGNSTWCTGHKSHITCMPLKNGPTDCGSVGNNGVHTYEFKSGRFELISVTNSSI